MNRDKAVAEDLQIITYFVFGNIYDERNMSYRFLSDVLRMRSKTRSAFICQREPELVHHPIRLGALSSIPTIVNKGFLEADALVRIFGCINRLVDPRGFPETRARYSVGPYAVPVLPSPHAEEVPLFLPDVAYLFIAIPTKPNK